MGILQKKRRTTGKTVLAYRAKGGQNTDTAFRALRLRVVLDLLILGGNLTPQIWEVCLDVSVRAIRVTNR